MSLTTSERKTTEASSDYKLSELSIRSPWQDFLYRTVAGEISRYSKYYDSVVQLAPRNNDSGAIYRHIECGAKQIASTASELKGLPNSSLILLNGNLNYETDIQSLFSELRANLKRESRIVVIGYNPYLAWLYKLANAFGIRKGDVPETFLTKTDLQNLARLSGLEVVNARNVGYIPFNFFGIGVILNAVLQVLPLINNFAFSQIAVLRPVFAESSNPSMSIVIPARNERGNIENALKRLTDLDDVDLEIIFVEGHSTDGTWDEIQRVAAIYRQRYDIKIFKQNGKGKADAVRLGFSYATRKLLTILDADLSMPPELLHRFYRAYCQGLADFINGSRLLYPIEGKAMRFLNKLGNIFFAKVLSWVLSANLGDSLCGTKLMTRDAYQRFTKWRTDFGNFDPFGDFELLFPASILGLGIIDVPIRYRDRTYGQTNISRFRHGLMLLRMTIIGFLRITLGCLVK